MDKIDIAVIGAGVVGLSVASQLADNKRSIALLERHTSFGQETSSRNSEVIHAGIYYEPGSLKAKLCVEGNRLLYELCGKNSIPHRKTGKVIVATNMIEEEQLNKKLSIGKSNGAPGLKLISREELRKLEPNVFGTAAMLSPETGIIDSHSLMKYYANDAKAKGTIISYDANVKGVKKIANGYEIIVSSGGEEFSFIASIVINCAGLESDTVAQMAGIDVFAAKYDLKLCKGDYFSVGRGKNKMVNRLVYPVPMPKDAGLGVHATLNLQGELRLGPDAHYLGAVDRTDLDYSVSSDKAREFYAAAKGLFPFIELDDLSPDTSGIRPKLQGENEDFRDFVIAEESAKGLPGFINLIGIESPGLTAAPAIARYVDLLLR